MGAGPAIGRRARAAAGTAAGIVVLVLAPVAGAASPSTGEPPETSAPTTTTSTTAAPSGASPGDTSPSTTPSGDDGAGDEQGPAEGSTTTTETTAAPSEPTATLGEGALDAPCAPGQTTGVLEVEAFAAGNPTTVDRIVAVSDGPSPTTGLEGGVELGDGPGGANGPTSPLAVAEVEGDQTYTVEVVFFGRQRRATFSDVAVRACATSTIRAWTGAPPAGTPGRWRSITRPVHGTYHPVPGDFTGDGRDDVFWYAPGAPMDHLWEASGAAGSFTSRPFPVQGAYWPTAGDFDGDGVDDLYFFGPGATADYKWYFDVGGGSYTSVADPAGLSSTTTTRSGDFDGNGVDDLLFFTPDGTDSVWHHAPGGAHSTAPISLGGAANVAVGDLDGDRRADVVHHQTLTGALTTHYGNDDGSFSTRSGTTWRTTRPIVGDLSCNLRADLLQYQAGDAGDQLWQGRRERSPMFLRDPGPLQIRGSYLHPFVGDFDGNGCDDVFWYQPGAALDYLWLNDLTGWHLPTSTSNGAF